MTSLALFPSYKLHIVSETKLKTTVQSDLVLFNPDRTCMDYAFDLDLNLKYDFENICRTRRCAWQQQALP